MPKAKRKLYEMTVTVSLPADFTPYWHLCPENFRMTNAKVRREVKHIINEGVGFLTEVGDDLKVVSIKGVKI